MKQNQRNSSEIYFYSCFLVKNYNFRINIGGLGIGNGFIYPPDQVASTDMLLSAGIMNKKQRDFFKHNQTTIKELITNGD